MKKLLLCLIFCYFVTSLPANDKPNILWIFAEDTSPWMGCYGDKVNAEGTPAIDSIANSGVIFKRAFVPAPVCSACRSAMIVGQNQIRFGAHEHRSSRSEDKIYLPEGYKLLPQIMAEHGYSTFNIGKTDYNFVWNEKKTYTISPKLKGNLWKDLKSKQPFFGQIQTKGGKNNTKKYERKVKRDSVTIPPDYPQNDLYKEVVAEHYDSIRKDDDLIGEILRGIKESGLEENTIVVYFSDHGANNLLRHKQMTTEGGLHVPFVVKGPEKFVPKNQVRNDLVNMLDLTATTLAWAGIKQPEWYEGRNLFAENLQARKFVASGKDRLDHTIDRVRSIRTENFRYVRNFKLDRIFLQPQYRDRQAYTKNLHELYRTGKISAKLKEIYFGERPAEELYDVSKDPHMLNNLVDNPSYREELARHRKLLNEWLSKGDKGVGEESVVAMKYNGEGKKWGEAVNPEYEVYRKDSDGDGLSDKWEKINGRNPQDGLLQFDFNCGGWQTEGWQSADIKSNIAGFLGYLDFTLDSGKGSIVRKGLKLKASSQDKALSVKLKSSSKLKVGLVVNGNLAKIKEVEGGKYQLLEIPLENYWQGEINSVKLSFEGVVNTSIEIDYIKVVR